MTDASIYVHIPFCARKCAYCDFASWADRKADIGRYFDALFSELEGARERFGPIPPPSVYIGGGTPTIAPTDLLFELLSRLNGLFPFQRDAEVTVEGNPGTVTPESLRMLKKAGANRLSFGAQAFQPRLLKTLGRIHGPEEIRSAVDMAREAGFENVSIDLMYALPGQTTEDFRESLQEAVSMDIPHISCYSLIAEPGTPLTKRIEAGELSLPDEGTTLGMQRMAENELKKGGLSRYEISNYAKPGFESRHNLRYWRRGDYLGLGCAAHSLMNGERFHNPDTLDAYLEGERYVDIERLSPRDEREEAILLETRTTSGICLSAFRERYGLRFQTEYAKGIRELLAGGYAVLEGDRFFLTERGLDVQSAAVLALVGGET